ncbi:kinesin-like protein KIF27 [Notolabrus celidotus]|uniref:kinesin-like protein KIF27 n=1 Tax=Notolabrus celidotus TaxID=1203425 RepID=UPI0014900409|nr:kinesin-like protein KIF27 [Notolabrus celidotus]
MSEVSIQVAVRVRPLLSKEVVLNHRVSVWTEPDSTDVVVSPNCVFSFDHTFGPDAEQDELYETCVQPLVEYLMDGFNATVFCYGQTGSGKTYTLGGRNQVEEGGIIQRVAQDVFSLLEEKRTNSDGLAATVRVSFIECYMEELRDLLELPTMHKALHIRDDEKGNTVVVGAKEVDVYSTEELLSVLEKGNAVRHTATTRMNVHSSRSHTIFTIQIFQCCPGNKFVRSSKLCLVDLAGSERADKTNNTGVLLKELVHNNTGLLALGKVIRALCEIDLNRRSNKANNVYVPYRDAKITRLLRDSLGGTAHTLMVVCVSPSNQSVTETLRALQFASKARQIHNHPGARPTHIEVKSFPTTWNPGKARLGDLEREVKTLRELLKDKEREIEMERTNGSTRQGNSSRLSGQSRISEKPEEPSQYRLLAQEAAALLSDLSGPTASHSFRQRVQEWQDRLAAVNHSHQADDKECSERGDGQSNHVEIIKLREELSKCKEALTIHEQLFAQKDAELRQAEKDVDRLLQENKAHMQALEEEKGHTRLQDDQLVDQQILINQLRSDLMTFRDATSGGTGKAGASENFGTRPHSAPLIRLSCGHGAPRRIHSSPPAYSLERVMAAFKMRGHLLLAEIEEKDEVYCPFIKPQTESQKDQEDILVGRVGSRRSLNRTWTSQQKKSALKKKNTGTDQTVNGIPPVQATGTEENQSKRNQMRKARLRASVTQRQIRDLSVNMRMKEELIKEINNTDKKTKALNQQGRLSKDGRESDVLMRLSMQRRRIQSEVYHSLQHMRLQKAQLQSSLRELEQNGEQEGDDMTVCRSKHHEELKRKFHDRNWLEEEEERVLQKRAELQELEGELGRREEVLLHRDTCLQQKNKLEIKKLQSSQALSQDLLCVAMQLESVEEQMKSRSSFRLNGGVSREELEKERDILRKRRDTLDAQLKDNRVLTVEEEHSLLELEESIEALNAALEFRNHSIQDKQNKLSITDSSTHQSKSSEPAQFFDVIRKLKELSPPEATELLVKYFNKVVCLREVEHYLRLRCEELQIHAGEQELVIRELETAMQHLTLDADCRITELHRDHQSNIQLLLQKLKEGSSGEPQQAIQERLQHLEKELFFYKSSSRQLKKKLRELHNDAQNSVDQPSHSLDHRQTQIGANQLLVHSEESQASTHILTTYTKIQAEQIDQQTHNDSLMKGYSHQTPSPSSSSHLHVHTTTNIPEYHEIQTESQGQRDRGAGEHLVMAPVRLCRRELRQITPADLLATRGRQSVLDASSESLLEDSIEVSKNTDR